MPGREEGEDRRLGVGGVAEGRKTVGWVERVGGRKRRKMEADKKGTRERNGKG